MWGQLGLNLGKIVLRDEAFQDAAPPDFLTQSQSEVPKAIQPYPKKFKSLLNVPCEQGLLDQQFVLIQNRRICRMCFWLRVKGRCESGPYGLVGRLRFRVQKMAEELSQEGMS